MEDEEFMDWWSRLWVPAGAFSSILKPMPDVVQSTTPVRLV